MPQLRKLKEGQRDERKQTVRSEERVHDTTVLSVSRMLTSPTSLNRPGSSDHLRRPPPMRAPPIERLKFWVRCWPSERACCCCSTLACGRLVDCHPFPLLCDQFPFCRS